MTYDWEDIREYQTSTHEIGYTYFNPNPRGCVVRDCVKRALVVATDIDYKELELFMNRNKVIKSEPYNSKKNWKHYTDLLGGKKISGNVPAGTKRWTVNSLHRVINNYQHLTFVIQVAGHLIGIRDNTIYDLFDDREYDKGIYAMWVWGASEQELEDIQNKISEGNRRWSL